MPATGRGTVGNLPLEGTSFVGRRRESHEVGRLLAGSRLVTLTGVGGTGKTRLAVRVAADRRRAFPDGAWFVDLTQLPGSESPTRNVRDPDVLAYLVTTTLGLRVPGRGPPLRALVEQLADRRMLLILDSCEHLIPASVILADALLGGCPGLRILVTSRERLAIVGETTFEVPPLPVPDPGHQLSLAGLGRYEAVTLFLVRAQAVVPGFGLTADNHLAVTGLCHRLDGLPLAIELAAARVRVLEPQEILDRLTDRFAPLGSGRPHAPQRQRTLRACVDWSFDLCAKPERMLWARLSVFAGTFELDAIEGICADVRLPEVDLLDVVAGLVEKSILVRDDVQGGPAEAARFRMLETIRDHGRDRLVAAGEDAVLRRRHRDWYQRLAARAAEQWVSDRQAYWLARLAREHPNLRAAVQFCLAEPGEAEAALRLAVCLPRACWSARGLFGEGRRWLEGALAQARAPTALRARALLINSFLAFSQGDAAAGIRLLDEGEELACHLDARTEIALAAYLRGIGALYVDDLPVAVQTLHRAWTILSQAPESDPALYQSVLLAFAVAAGVAGDHKRAAACQQEMLAIVEPGGESLYQSLALWAGGLLAWLRGDLWQATAQEQESLRLKRAWDSQDRYGTALSLEVLAWISADHRHHRRTATLLGAADALWTDLGIPVSTFGQFIGYHDACERQTRDALDAAGFIDAFRQGQDLAYDDAIAYALLD